MIVLQVLAVAMGFVFVGFALRALRDGYFRSPAAMVHGTPTGEVRILRAQRPAAYWLCVGSYLVFGLGTLAAAWLIG